MVIYGASFDVHTGYGRVARSVLGVLDAGARIVCAACPGDLMHRYVTARPDIAVAPPHYQTDAPCYFTMYESTEIPKPALAFLKERKQIIVPCAHDEKVFRSHGLTRVDVCHLSCSPRYTALPPLDNLVFLHNGADYGCPMRKRSADIIKAFQRAFPRQGDVHLIVKKTPNCAKLLNFDRRVTVIAHTMDSKALKSLTARAHCGVYLSGQESWGYPHLDMMATGRPVISPIYGGPAEYLDDTCGYSLPYSMIRVPKPYFKGIGHTAKASTDALVERFRFLYQNREDIVLKGVMAYRRALGFTELKFRSRLTALLSLN